MKLIKFLAELVYDIATIHSHPTGHPNFDNEASKRNWRESQKPLRGANHNNPNWPGDHYGG